MSAKNIKLIANSVRLNRLKFRKGDVITSEFIPQTTMDEWVRSGIAEDITQPKNQKTKSSILDDIEDER